MKCKNVDCQGCRVCDLEAELAGVREQLRVARVAACQSRLVVPSGWFVQEMGQSMVSNLWFCHLVERQVTGNGRRRRVMVSDCVTAEAALTKAKRLIEARSFAVEELCEAG